MRDSQLPRYRDTGLAGARGRLTVAAGGLLALAAIAPAGAAAESDAKPERRAKAHATAGEDALGTMPEGLGVPVGEAVPASATATNLAGDPVAVRELTAERPLLLVFYRGGWCPYCNFQIRALAQKNDAFGEHGVGLAAASVDTVDESMKTDAAWEIPFPVLSDPGLQLHRAFNVIYEAPPEEVERLAGYGIDLEASSGRDHHSFAVPAIFLIGTDGTVLWSHADRDYKIRPSPEQLLEVVAKEVGGAERPADE